MRIHSCNKFLKGFMRTLSQALVDLHVVPNKLTFSQSIISFSAMTFVIRDIRSNPKKIPVKCRSVGFRLEDGM